MIEITDRVYKVPQRIPKADTPLKGTTVITEVMTNPDYIFISQGADSITITTTEEALMLLRHIQFFLTEKSKEKV